MKTTPNLILKIVHVLFWIAFIGLCIKTGALLTALLVSLFVNTGAATDLYLGLNLSSLFHYSQSHYITVAILLLLLTGIKAHIAYYVVQFFLKFDLEKPFDSRLTKLFLKISYVSLGAGLLAMTAEGYCNWLEKQAVDVPLEWGGSEILFFSGVIYLLALVFKKGHELQTENEFTV